MSEQPDPVLMATGVMQHVTREQMDDTRFEREIATAQRTGNHLWASVVTFKASEENIDAIERGEPLHMDHENLLNYPGLGCMVCEQPFSKSLRLRRCKGQPKRTGATR